MTLLLLIKREINKGYKQTTASPKLEVQELSRNKQIPSAREVMYPEAFLVRDYHSATPFHLSKLTGTIGHPRQCVCSPIKN